MTRPRLAVTVGALALNAAASLALLHVVRTVAWPAVVALLRLYGLDS